ncbi:hypothetical protein FJY71_02215 [candidate division WOR-3 bacterium]|nr:hypothetical protein [candidate division WOR-3 bacterium]
MMLPPRPLPLSDRIYLRTRYQLDADRLARLEQTGMDRSAIVELLERNPRRPAALSPGGNRRACAPAD